MDARLPAKSSHVPELDGLRALAAFAVAAFHCRAPWATGGFLGVDVFFVLSGWLITGLLARELERTGRIDVRGFLARRMRRLYPALLFMAVCLTAVAPAIWPDALATVAYMMDFYALTPGRDHAILHSWSLAIEAQFYLLWPFVLVGLLRLGRARAGIWLGGAWLGVTLLRAMAGRWGVSAPVLYFTPLFHCTGLLLGSALALAEARLPRWRLQGWVGLVAILASVVLSPGLTGHVPNLAAAPVAELATAALILAPPKVLAWRPLVAAGAISYAFYLWSPIVAYWPALWPWPVRLARTMAFGLALATVSYWLVERPLRPGARTRSGKSNNDTPRRAVEPSV